MNDYPGNWREIAIKVKAAAGWRCVRCGHPHEYPGRMVNCDDLCIANKHPGGLNDGRQRMLTVHHLDGDKANCEWWNLAALCQVCHLIIQARYEPMQLQFWPEEEWLTPYVEGRAQMSIEQLS
jgi:hypothetical protein